MHGSRTKVAPAATSSPLFPCTNENPISKSATHISHVKLHDTKPITQYILKHMKSLTLTIPELVLIAATRGILGAGLALLISSHLNETQRKTAGAILTTIGVLSTIPLAFEVMGKSNQNRPG